jgi:7-cyano-7-deazaguanine synthase
MSELLLLSGGIDSMALAAWRKPAVCLTIDYGQRPSKGEIIAATQACRDLNLSHEVLTAPVSSLGSGDLSVGRSAHSPHSDFWPFRNQYLITLAGMMAMNYGCHAVVIGTVSTDRRHADGSPNFVKAMNQLLVLQEGSLRLLAPASDLTSAELVLQSGIPRSTLAWSHSCHVGDIACGTCAGCEKHQEVIEVLGWAR